MGLFTRKKRDPPSPAAPAPPPSSAASRQLDSLSIPYEQTSRHPGLAENSRPAKNVSPTSSSSRFHNIFRSASRPDPAPATRPVPPRQSFSDPVSTPYAQKDVRDPRDHVPGRISTSESIWDDAGAPLGRGGSTPGTPNSLDPLDRYRLFATGQAKGASTLSLPVFDDHDANEGRRRISTSTARESNNEMIYAVESRQEEGHGASGSGGDAGGKWSRWKLGRGQKQRSGSMSSARFFGGDGSNGASRTGDESGFVVTSFRSVSRVHEDPISPVTPTSPPLPPLPSLPAQTDISPYEQPDHQQQQESIRASIDLGSSQPRRPPLNVYGPGSNGASPPGFADRAPSPSTISVEAFRLASARSKSSVSLVSLPNMADAHSPPLDSDRPKFEPVQRPSSRASRRQSTYSDLGLDSGSSFLPPRPRFAHHSNSSSSSIQSRKSSNPSIGNQTPPLHVRSVEGNALSTSESVMSINSYTTAVEPRTAPTSAQSTPATQRIAPSGDATRSALTRPPNAKRLSSSDSELRLIASYADSITSNEFSTSPVAYKNSPLPAAVSASTPRSKGNNSRDSHAPSFAVQPPTPATVSDVTDSPSASPSATRPPANRQYPKRSSSLATDATKAALQSMIAGDAMRRQSFNSSAKPAVSPLKSKAQRSGPRGWMSDSSDEDEQEALETDNSNSDSEDEVPLSQIKSRSQTDLSLPPALVQAEQRARAELEAAAAQKAVQAAESKLNGSSATGLVRRSSNRRSVSTLSISTAAMAIPTATAASSSSPNLVPSSPTRSILQRPHHPRSVSNPNTPFPTVSSTAAAPPVPALSAGIADRSSSSSGTGSSSSALLTPGDLSPAVSDLGLKSQSGLPNLGKPSVKFDLAALSSSSAPNRFNKSRRTSAIQSSQSNIGFQPSRHRPTQSLQPSFSPFGASNAGSVAPARGPRSSIVHTPSSTTLASSRTAVETNASPGDVYDRMKSRHKKEAVDALKIGTDLNHPSGFVPVHDDEDDEDEDEPLANLPTRGGAASMIGGMDAGGGGSMIAGMSPYGGMGMGMGMGFGGVYSPLAMAPPGVDPYLCQSRTYSASHGAARSSLLPATDASLPPDQKMSLHQRSQQMMAMMQQAAVQAKAESVAGSAMGGYGNHEGSMLGGEGSARTGAPRGPRGNLHGASMSMSNLNSFASYGSIQPQVNASARLPPFAPSFAMSAPFMHPGMTAHQHSASLYQAPAYANSSIGFSPAMHTGGRGSIIGAPTNSKGLNPGGRAASMLGFDQRR
ncbi:uncharacterized protein JCM15063_005267 [Sporobolomyces koalae]|uniref:uncharacterized protein n=1 Tax=Sporobolomyces koalae TaxID=500713 RepID=UPI00317129B6